MDESFDFLDENEEPEIWDEHQWEEFMRESDMRTEKFSRLFEKYMDHPDRQRLIAIEMGWYHLLDEMEEESEDFLFNEFEEGEEWKQETGYEIDEYDSFENFPLYQQAYQYALDVIELVESRLKDEEDESVRAFASSALIPPAKIAGGYGMGFEMESLGGNIANCKRGLTAANRMLTALQELKDKNLLDQETFHDFYARGKEVRDTLAIYIVELRERFRKGIP